jgi:RNA polymerase primary sigma factor
VQHSTDIESDEPRAESRADEPIGSLGRYYRDVARVEPLRPRAEFALAQRLEVLELRRWERLLGYSPALAGVATAAERALGADADSLTRVREATDALAEQPTAAGRERLHKAVRAAAVELRTLDRDRLAVEAALAEVERLAAEVPGRARGRELGIDPAARAFLAYVRRVRQAQRRALAAKNELVQKNLRLVMIVARRFDFGRMPLQDLIQEGNLGLVKAVERFDWRRGYRFSTYASWWIRHAISRALADKGRAVRLPVYLTNSYHRIARAERELQSRLGRAPTVEELSAATGLSPRRIEEVPALFVDASVSLDRPLGDEEDGRKLGDVLAAPGEEHRTHADRLIDRAMNEEVHAALGELKPVEAEILKERFGLDGAQPRTLREIGAEHGLSRERIRQIQEQALDKLRRALGRKDLL